MNRQEIGQTYRELGTQGAAPLELVIMLYDVLLDDLGRAIEALHARDVEKRTSELQHALRVLEQLQGSLDMDRGGEPARNLDHLYSMVRAKLIEAQWKASEDILRHQMELLAPVRDAWRVAVKQQQLAAGQAMSPLPAVRSMESDNAYCEMDWRA
jgi:flagellar protein FliS